MAAAARSVTAALVSVAAGSDLPPEPPAQPAPDGLPPSNRGVTLAKVVQNSHPLLTPRLDYFQASVRAEFDLVATGLLAAFGDGPPEPAKGYHGYGLGWSIPTHERGTLTVNPAGIHEYPSVRVSGWPSEPVAAFLRGRWEGQASRVDAAVDFSGDLTAWCQSLTEYAQVAGMKWGTYHVGARSTGVELGAGKSESRTRCYDASLKHPGEFAGQTYRLEHEWKPAQKPRKELAYVLDAGTVLGTSRPAAVALELLAGLALPAAPGRTRRVSELERWHQNQVGQNARRYEEWLAFHQGDLVAFALSFLGAEDQVPEVES